MYLTAENPDWQTRMRNEVCALQKPFLEYEDLDQLQCVDQVFHESIRLHPSVPLMMRRTIRDCDLGAFRVPAHTLLFLVPTYNHRMPEYWSMPELFDPERFSAARQEHKKHSFQYLPFGGGAHKCLGIHFALIVAKVFMFHVLQHYEYRVPENARKGIDDFPLPHPTKRLRLQLLTR